MNQKILEQFSGKKILVLGDIMLDKYIWGEVSRISPEAPVQVVEAKKESYAAGGAANVASNISSLGGKAIMVGRVGQDESKKILIKQLEQQGIDTTGIVSDGDKPTTMKVRIMGRSQQLLRVDYEDTEHTHPDIEAHMISHLSKVIDKVDGVIISDYAKGVVTKKLLHAVMTQGKKRSIPIVIDPKPVHQEMYTGATLITPNHNEASEMVGHRLDSDQQLLDGGQTLVSTLDANVLLTRGEHGMSLFEKDNITIHIQTDAKEVFDVTGAGDTVVATAALCLSSGASLKDAALLANRAAGIKVGKIGAAPVTISELQESL